jgi:hypothetical protein
MAEETPARPSGSAAKRGLQKKIGPLPLWAWGGLAIGGALAYYFAKGKGKKSATTQPTAQPTAQATTPAVGTLASQVPQFVNQTYTNPAPPAVTQTVNNTTNPPATPPPPHKSGDEDQQDRPRPTTGGWKGQHSNGQGSHHGKRRTHPLQPRPLPQTPGQPKIAY